MLTAVPIGWFSRRFAILQESGRQVGELGLSWRERGELTIDGGTYEIARDGWGGPFVLGKEGSPVASATKAPFRRSFTIECDTSTLTLSGQFFGRQFNVSDGSTPIGTVRPAGLFSGTVEMDLPERLPLELRVFIAWLAMIMWRRSARAAAGG